jgi:alpha-amylase
MMKARKLLAYGEQKDFFNHPQLVGWIREGLDENPFSGLAVLLNRSRYIDSLELQMGNRHAKKRFRELNGSFRNVIETDEHGRASFPVKPGAISIWIREEAKQWFD